MNLTEKKFAAEEASPYSFVDLTLSSMAASKKNFAKAAVAPAERFQPVIVGGPRAAESEMEAEKKKIRDKTEELDRASSALKAAALEWEKIRESLSSRVADKVLDLSMAVAEKIVEGKVAADPNFIKESVKKALASVWQNGPVKIHLHPDDLEEIKAAMAKGENFSDEIKEIELISDSGVKRGGCRVEGDFGEVDARIDSQIGALRQALAEAMDLG